MSHNKPCALYKKKLSKNLLVQPAYNTAGIKGKQLYNNDKITVQMSAQIRIPIV